jgi:hypothetical protein
MQGFVVCSVLTVAAANNLFNAEFNRCMDIKILCMDNTDTPGCERQDPHTLRKGANLQLWDCHDDENQNFEILGGRLRNTVTGHCLDIKAMCLDGSDTPGCERQSVADLKVDANIQLWDCRTDDAAGMDSNSYGNQKWDFLQDGTIRNEGCGLCLTAGGGKTDTSGRNLHVHECGQSGQIFDFERGSIAEQAASTGGQQVVAVGQSGVTVTVPQGATVIQGGGGVHEGGAHGIVNGYSSVQVVHPGYVVGALGLVVAAVALFAARNTPVSNEVQSVALISE